jgi:hypothetical protein
MERTERVMDRRNPQFYSVVEEFITLAERTMRRIGDEYYIFCPCCDCKNAESCVYLEVEYHLCKRGFMDGYARWTRHGEESVMGEGNQVGEMPNPNQSHMDVESNHEAHTSSY